MTTNPITALDAAQATCLHFRHRWRGASEFLRSTRMNVLKSIRTSWQNCALCWLILLAVGASGCQTCQPAAESSSGQRELLAEPPSKEEQSFSVLQLVGDILTAVFH